MIRHVSYSYNGLKPVSWLSARLRSDVADAPFDSMVGIGISGALVVPALGRSMRKKWALIRKDGVNSHARTAHLEGQVGSRFLIVDDQVSSGSTVANILRKVALAADEVRSSRPEWTGVWLYNHDTNGYLSPEDASAEFGKIGQAWAAYRGLPSPPVTRLCGCGCGQQVKP